MPEPFPFDLAKQLLESGARSHPAALEAWLAAGMRGDPPKVFPIRPPTSDMLGGRYFPQINVALVYEHADSRITRATVIHETGHGINYKTRCRGWKPGARTRCGYVGQHDRKFYTIVKPLYVDLGVQPREARAVESDCTGDYECPPSWRRIERW